MILFNLKMKNHNNSQYCLEIGRKNKETHGNCNDKFRIKVTFGGGSGTQGIFPALVILYFLSWEESIKWFANHSFCLFVYLKYSYMF